MPIVIELDCTEAVHMITAPVKDRSMHCSLVDDIQQIVATSGREVLFISCSRTQNNVSHELAAYGHSPCTAVWLGSGPEFAVNLVLAERPP